MKWDITEVDKYEEAKEYIDTALVPIISIEMGENMRLSTANARWLTGIVQIMEEQLVGRVMLFPTISYIADDPHNGLFELINKEDHYLRQHGFKYVIFVTNETPLLKDISVEKLYIEALTSESLDFTKDMMIKEGYNLVPKLTSFWKKG